MKFSHMIFWAITAGNLILYVMQTYQMTHTNTAVEYLEKGIDLGIEFCKREVSYEIP